MGMISWIMTTRNDGYGDCPGIDNFAMTVLKMSCKSIRNISMEDEIIVVEYAPDKNRESLNNFIHDIPDVKVITVSDELQTILEMDSDRPIKYYEYIAKHIGSKRASSDYFMFCNPDNIYPSGNFINVRTFLEQGNIARGVRYEIKKEYLQMDVDELIKLQEIPHIHTAKNAAGDFCGVPKTIYDAVGGFKMLHINSYLDVDLVWRAVKQGYGDNTYHSTHYYHYHIEHDKNRRNTPWQNIYNLDGLYKPISQNIVDCLEDYVL